VIDQAYLEYVTDPEYPDAIEEYVKAGHRAVAVRTFSKIYGLAGLRIGYAIAHEHVVRATSKSRRAFDVTSPALEAALASLGSPDTPRELDRRRRLNAERRRALEAELRRQGLDPVGPAVGNFLYAEVGEDAAPLFDALLREGVIVRPLAGFGSPGAIRVTVGTPEENAFFGESLARVLSRAAA
jgi:histidinol-phosphate aminotransferase